VVLALGANVTLLLITGSLFAPALVAVAESAIYLALTLAWVDDRALARRNVAPALLGTLLVAATIAVKFALGADTLPLVAFTVAMTAFVLMLSRRTIFGFIARIRRW
jgi:hypothetical protein